MREYVVRGDLSEQTVSAIRDLGVEIVRYLPRFKYLRIRTTGAIAAGISRLPGVTGVGEPLPAVLNKVNTTEGDVSHKANLARSTFGVTGEGVKVGVISDSARYLSDLQTSGDLPANVTVLSGYSGVCYNGAGARVDTGEGTGMMEIVHDLAPGALLYFASGSGTQYDMASAIDALAAAGCRIIVDDISYDSEPALQESEAVEAVNDFVRGGGLYFSCAINYGNKAAGTSCVWEGDFTGEAQTVAFGGVEYEANLFSSTDDGVEVTSGNLAYLQWADDFSSSRNDYRLVVLFPNDDIDFGVVPNDLPSAPFQMYSSSSLQGATLMILKPKSAPRQYVRLVVARGGLSIGTSGATWGHCAASGAFTIAAAPVRPSGVYTGSESVETYSSDGPRRIFRDVDGVILNGGLLSANARTLEKVDFTAADNGLSKWSSLYYRDFYGANVSQFGGTSAAAPHAAAIAALMLEASPKLTRDEVMEIFKASTFSSSGWDCTRGYGIIDAYKSVEQACKIGGAVPKIPAAPTVSLSGTRLSWNAVAGANYYKVYRSSNPYAEPEALSGWQTACSYTCSAPSSYGSYFYFVKASSTGEDATASAFSTQDAHLSYGSYAEVHKYGSSSFNVTPVSSDSTPLFNMTFYKLSGSSTAISGSFNGTTIGNGYPTVGSSGSSQLIIARNTFTVSGSSNTSSTPRFWGFYTTFANPPAGSWSSTGGKSYAEVVWLAHPHYYYQSGVASFSTGATSQSAGKDGGAYSVSVTATPLTTSWSASTSADWITLYRTSSSGSGVLGYAVAANDTSSPRTGTITISGASTTKTLTVTQAAGEAPATLSSISISGSSSVTSGEQATYTCKASYSDGSSKTVLPSWSIYSGASYASISSSGVLTAKTVTSPQSVRIRAVYGGVSQDKTVTVNPKITVPSAPSITISTYGMSSANPSYIKVSWSGGSGATSFNLYRSVSGTRPSSPFATNVTSPYYDSSSSLIPGVKYYYWVAAVNSAGTAYSDSNWGNILVSLSLEKTSDDYAAAGGSGGASVTANTSWSASADASWITLGTKSGSGNGMLTYTVAANTSSSSRKGTVTVTAGSGTSYPATRTIVVTQEGASEFVVVGGVLTKYNGSGGAVTIPTGVTEIGNGAFANCFSLTSVTIPSGVRSIGVDAFWQCVGLSEIIVSAGNAAYSSLDGILYDKAKAELILCPAGKSGSVAIPRGVRKICDSAFAFCETVTSVSIPSSVTSIGDYTFAWCGCLESVTIPSGVTSVGDYAFYECCALESVTIPSSVTSIGCCAFACCCALESVTIPLSVTSIGDSAFDDCDGLKSVSVSGRFQMKAIFGTSCAGIVAVKILPGEKSIEGWMCYGCEALKSVTIPSGVTTIGASAFQDCRALESVSIPSSVSTIGDSAFWCCSGLGDGVVVVDGCVLTVNGLCPPRVALQQGVRLIASAAFASCGGLTAVAISSSVTSIGDYAFAWCGGLESVTIPPSVESIGHDAFLDCHGLKAVTIPSSIRLIGDWAFDGCSSLETIHVSGGGIDVVKRKLSDSGFDVWSVNFDCNAQPDADLLQVKFKANGGTVTPTVRACWRGDPLGDMPVPQLDGSNFLGWFTAADGGIQVSPNTIVDGSFTKLYAHWASRKGSSPASAKLLAVGVEEKSRAFTLTEEYDEEERRGTGSGAYYHKVTLEKGKAYTFCLTDASADCWLDVFTDWNDPTWAFFEHEECAGIQAAFLYPDAWDRDDPDHATFYVRVQGAVGDTAVLHYSEGIVTDYFPKGSDLNPKVINGAKIDYSRTLVYGEYCFNVWLDAGEDYSIAVRDDGTNRLKLDCEDEGGIVVVRRSDTALELRSDTSRYVMVRASGKKDREFLFTSTKAFYWLTFDSAGGSPVEPLRYGYGLPMDNLPVPVREGYRFVRWRFAADNAKVKATTLMPSADTALVAQWTELGRPYFVTTEQKVYEDAGYAELQVVRTSGEGALSVRWTTSDLTAFAGVDYVASEGILSWAQGDMEAKTVRVKLIPDLVGRYEVSNRFTVSLSSLSEEEATSRGEYVAVLGAAATSTVKVKNVDARSVGMVAVVGEPLAVTAGGTLCVRVARTGGDDGRIAVTVKTQPGTALADVDYVHVSETLVWGDGEDGEKVFLVDTLDAKSAEAKTFNVKLTALAEWEGEALDVPATPVRKAYVTLNGTAEPPSAIKASFTVTGPGMFTAEPYIASGSGILKYKTTGGWAPIPSGKTFNLSVPAGETTVQFKIASASSDARLAFVKQIRDLDYRIISLTNPAYLQVAADGSLVDSKGREVFFEGTYELTQGVFGSVSEDFFGVDNPMTLVGGNVPTGMFTYVGDGDWVSGLCLAPCIEGVPVKAKDYVAVFRFTAGEYKKRIVILTFKIKAADLDFGNYFGVLRTDDPVSDFARLGWFKYSVAADGTVSAKATVGGFKYKFSERSFDVGEGSRVPATSAHSWDGGSQVGLAVNGGVATVDFGHGLPTYSCEIHRAESGLADFAGYYTLALVPTDCCWCEPPCGNGYLTLTVGADGSVVTAGKFPNGTDFTASSVAYRAGDALEIPVFAAVAPWSFGGVLRIRPDRTVELGKAYNASVFDSSASLDWNGSPFGGLRLVPAGGYYNTVFNLQTYYLNRDFSIDMAEAPYTALELVGNAFGPNTTNTKLTFARETGIVSGKFDNWQTGTRVRYYGVVPMYRDAASQLSASVWATGFYLLPKPDGSVESKPFAINAE